MANFHTPRPIAIAKLPGVLNASLPRDVKVQRCEDAPLGFHARRCALSRTYRYRVIERPAPSPLLGRHALIVPPRLEVAAMAAAAAPLLGRHDFRAFQASGSETMTTERTLMRLDCHRTGDTIDIAAEADGFLYHMVRIIVSALLRVGAALSHRMPSPGRWPRDGVCPGQAPPRLAGFACSGYHMTRRPLPAGAVRALGASMGRALEVRTG